jgi:hypothetical protein
MEWVEVKRWYINHRQRQKRLPTATDGESWADGWLGRSDETGPNIGWA